jgi:hypothetical protein
LSQLGDIVTKAVRDRRLRQQDPTALTPDDYSGVPPAVGD